MAFLSQKVPTLAIPGTFFEAKFCCWGEMGKSTAQVYQFKISLLETHPAIWRRIQVPDWYTFADLHGVIQKAMGWDDVHLYEFTAGGGTIPKDTKISRIFSVAHPCVCYQYDFGDDWMHEVVLEKISPVKRGAKYPVCIAGKRACPPEDCGGAEGFFNLLQIMKNPRHEEYRNMKEWLGGNFNPEKFDPKDVCFYEIDREEIVAQQTCAKETAEAKKEKKGEGSSAFKRKPAKQLAKLFAKSLRKERPDYLYLKSIFRHLRAELGVAVTKVSKRLPYVPTETEMQKYYAAVWQTRNLQHMVLIKTLLYTGLRVSEAVNIKIDDVDLEALQIRVEKGKGNKGRKVPIPQIFKELLAAHISSLRQKKAKYLFESSWERAYTTRGIRKILDRYTQEAGMSRSISPHKLRHFLFTWLKKQGIDDALIQPYSGHESRQSLEIYSKLSIGEAHKEYDKVIGKFPV